MDVKLISDFGMRISDFVFGDNPIQRLAPGRDSRKDVQVALHKIRIPKSEIASCFIFDRKVDGIEMRL
jgi:hypothetical protein